MPEKNFPVADIRHNSGYTMPAIGLGTWTMSNEQAEDFVYHAIKCGVRLIDTARYYKCERGVGRGIRKAASDGIVSRGEIFVTSKIMPADYRRSVEAINESLADLGLEYLDLMLIHEPGENDEEVYRAMEEAVQAGKLRSIGISNYYTKDEVDTVMSYAKIVPALIQNENHLYFQGAWLRDYIKQWGMVLENWYPFGGRGKTAAELGDAAVCALAEKYGKTPAQILLRWQLQDGYITIPGSLNYGHIAENIDVFGFELSAEEMQLMRSLDRQSRNENW